MSGKLTGTTSMVDRSGDYSILYRGRLSCDQVQLKYDERRWSIAYDQQHANHIETVWQLRKEQGAARGIKLYDSLLFRLGRLNASFDGLNIDVGLTSYKDYVGTRNHYDKLRPADPIGTAVIPVTVDGKVPLGKRSSDTDANAGKFFTFGGFFDAKLDVTGEARIPDLFGCVVRETKEELGLAIDRRSLELICITYDHLNCHPEAAFVARIPLSSESVERLPWQNELTDLQFVDLHDLHGFLDRFEGDTTITLVGALRTLASTRGYEHE